MTITLGRLLINRFKKPQDGINKTVINQKNCKIITNPLQKLTNGQLKKLFKSLQDGVNLIKGYNKIKDGIQSKQKRLTITFKIKTLQSNSQNCGEVNHLHN